MNSNERQPNTNRKQLEKSDQTEPNERKSETTRIFNTKKRGEFVKSANVKKEGCEFLHFLFDIITIRMQPYAD